MNTASYLTSLLSEYAILPAAFLCFAPMKNQLRDSARSVWLRITLCLAVLLPVTSFLEAYFRLPYNAVLPFYAIVAFAVYQRNLKTPLHKSFAVYAFAYAFISFFSNFANAFDARLHPASSPDHFSLEAAIFQAVLITAVVAVFFPFVRKYGSRVVDELDFPHVWYLTFPVSGIFLAYNLIHVPDSYESLYLEDGFRVYLASLVLLFLLLCLLCVHFYFIVSGILERARTQEKNHILELQESAYHVQQRYLEDSARARHDFKHTIGTLKALSDAGNFKAIRDYLEEYTAAQPKNEIINYCKNTAVNAVLNHYMQLAQEADIRVTSEISLPEKLYVSDIDLCSILGNILDNALLACEEIPENDRYMDLVVRPGADGKLYIVVTNSFNGIVKRKDGNYLSTRRHGQGMGLKSISSIAEKYGGSTRFRQDGTEFHTDVVL